MPVPAERPIAMLAPENPAARAARPLARLQPQLPRCPSINFGTRSPAQTRPFTAVDFRAGRAKSTGRSCARKAPTSPISSDRRRRSPSHVKKTGARADEAGLKRGRLPLLLLVPHGRRAGGLVHPATCPGIDRLPPVIDVECERRGRAASARPSPNGCGKRCRSSWTSWSATTASARLSIRAGLLPRQSAGRVPQSSLLAALGRGAPVQGLSQAQWIFWQYSVLGPVPRRRRGDRLNVFNAARKTGTTGWRARSS